MMVVVAAVVVTTTTTTTATTTTTSTAAATEAAAEEKQQTVAKAATALQRSILGSNLLFFQTIVGLLQNTFLIVVAVAPAVAVFASVAVVAA